MVYLARVEIELLIMRQVNEILSGEDEPRIHRLLSVCEIARESGLPILDCWLVALNHQPLN